MITTAQAIRSEVIHGMPEEEYYSLPYVSASLLKKASMDGLVAAKKMLEGEVEESEAMTLGRLCHLRVNDPDAWARYPVPPTPEELADGILTKDGEIPKNLKLTSAYKKRISDWMEANPDSLDPDDYWNVVRITETLLRSHCYRECSAHEIVILFEFMGLQAKCRIDGETLVRDAYDDLDWKFVASTKRFGKQIEDFRWHMQAGFYRQARRAVGHEQRAFYLIGVDKTRLDPAYTVCAPVSQKAMDIGLKECEYWMRRILQAQETDNWTGEESPSEWSLSRYYRPAFAPAKPGASEPDEWTP